MKFAIIVAVLAVAAFAEIQGYSRTVSYSGEKVLQCRLQDTAETGLLDSLVDKFEIDIFGTSAPGTVDIRVKDAYQHKAVLAAFKEDCQVTVEDLESIVQGWENDMAIAAANVSSASRSMLQNDPNWFTQYRSYADLQNWYRNFASANPTLVRFVPSIGRSFQGRDLFAIVVSNAPAGAPNFYMQCQIHAREWISGATCNWVINQLVADFIARDPTAVTILSSVHIHLVPFTNPDGYEWTRSNDRLWRKSRNTNPGSACIGTDLNRNYNDNWGRGGSSTNPCTDTYMGLAPADAPETQATSNYFRSIAPVTAAIDWHSYSQLILRPYGWTTANPPHEERLRTVGAAMATAIQQDSGRVYRNIKSIELYVTTGTASDWFYGVEATSGNRGYRAAGYTIELRPTGANPGFQLPPGEIVATGRENYQAFKVFATEYIRAPLQA